MHYTLLPKREYSVRMTETIQRVAGPVAEPRPLTAAADDRFLRFLHILTFAYPLLWLIGAAGFYWVLLGLAGIVYLPTRRWIARIAAPLVALVVILLASMPIGIVAFGFDLSRIASFFGNLLVWTGIIALVTLASVRPASVAVLISRGVLVIGTAQGAITFAAQLAYPTKLAVPLLEPLATRLPSGLAAFATNGLYVPDWLGEIAFRSSGMMGQPTWAGAVGAITAIVAVRALVVDRGAWRLVAVAALVAGMYSLDLSLSRSTQISLVVAVLVGVLVALRRYGALLFAVLSTCGAVALALVVMLFGSQIAGLLTNINDAREGSADSRGAIYVATFDFILRLPLPLIGYGIKPKEDGLVASIATHSSYLGLLFRGGVLGLLTLLVFFAIVLLLAVRASNGWAAALATLIAIWCLLEDLDPGHLVPLGIVLAYALSRRESSPPMDGAGTGSRPLVTSR